jgi:hypothetical protein
VLVFNLIVARAETACQKVAIAIQAPLTCQKMGSCSYHALAYAVNVLFEAKGIKQAVAVEYWILKQQARSIAAGIRSRSALAKDVNDALNMYKEHALKSDEVFGGSSNEILRNLGEVGAVPEAVWGRQGDIEAFLGRNELAGVVEANPIYRSAVNEAAEQLISLHVKIFSLYGKTTLDETGENPDIKLYVYGGDSRGVIEKFPDAIAIFNEIAHAESALATLLESIILDSVNHRVTKVFSYKGRQYTPHSYFKDVLRLDNLSAKTRFHRPGDDAEWRVLGETMKAAIDANQPVKLSVFWNMHAETTQGVLDDVSNGAPKRGGMHSIVLVGYEKDNSGNVTRWKVANWWGDDHGLDGWFYLTSAYMKKHLNALTVLAFKSDK